MDLNVEIWNAINETPHVPDEVKKALHIKILRLVEKSKAPTGTKFGITIMTQEASLAGDKSASDRTYKPDPGDAKPRTV